MVITLLRASQTGGGATDGTLEQQRDGSQMVSGTELAGTSTGGQ